MVLSAIALAAPVEHPPLDPRAKTDAKYTDIYLAALADEQQGFYASLHLAELGPSIVPKIVIALHSKFPIVRKYAVRTLSEMGPADAAPTRDEVVAAAARESDDSTLWSMVQAIGIIKCDPRTAVPVLLKVLANPSIELRRMTAEAIGELGPGAAAAKPGLINALDATSDSWLQESIMRSLGQIGIGAADVNALSRAKVRDDSEGALGIFRELVRAYPDLASSFLKAHPRLLAALPSNDLALIDLFARHDAASDKLRASLLKRADLPKFVRVDYAKGERIGAVMTLPRIQDPKLCFPQSLMVVRIDPGKPGDAGRAVIDRFAADPERMLWQSEGLAIIVIDHKWGFIDATTGRIVIPPKFDHAQNFAGERAAIVLDHKYGYVDKSGKLVIPPQFDWGYSFSHGMAGVSVGKKSGLIDTSGRWIKEPTYKQIDPWADGWKAWTFDDMEGLLDKKGELISPIKSPD